MLIFLALAQATPDARAASSQAADSYLMCVRDAARAWSKLDEDAATIARGAVASCGAQQTIFERRMIAEFDAADLGAHGRDEATRVMARTKVKVSDMAVAVILRERAKATPAPPR